MTAYVTGDLHRGHDGAKLFRPALDDLTKDDCAIVCGDFGIPWNDDESEAELLRKIDARPFPILFVDGNHENHALLGACPVEEWHGGKAHRLSSSVIHLMRGQVYEMDGRTFFAMGGAVSVDKAWRTPGWSLWPQDVPSEAERVEALTNLESHGNKVDCVLTHCAPQSVFDAMCDGGCLHALDKQDGECLDWLERNVKQRVEYKGHKGRHFSRHHEDAQVDELRCCLRNRLVMLPEAPGEQPVMIPSLPDARPLRFALGLQRVEPMDEDDWNAMNRHFGAGARQAGSVLEKTASRRRRHHHGKRRRRCAAHAALPGVHQRAAC